MSHNKWKFIFYAVTFIKVFDKNNRCDWRRELRERKIYETEKCKQTLTVIEYEEFDAELDKLSFLLHMHSICSSVCNTIVMFFYRIYPVYVIILKRTNSLSGINQTQQYILFVC
jgi:hypothetical protein